MYISNINYLLTSNTKTDKIELSVSKRQLITLRLVFWAITSKLSASKSSNIYRSSNSFNFLKHAWECQSMFVWLCGPLQLKETETRYINSHYKIIIWSLMSSTIRLTHWPLRKKFLYSITNLKNSRLLQTCAIMKELLLVKL